MVEEVEELISKIERLTKQLTCDPDIYDFVEAKRSLNHAKKHLEYLKSVGLVD